MKRSSVKMSRQPQPALRHHPLKLHLQYTRPHSITGFHLRLLHQNHRLHNYREACIAFPALGIEPRHRSLEELKGEDAAAGVLKQVV
jgi:hypothetical protein